MSYSSALTLPPPLFLIYAHVWFCNFNYFFRSEYWFNFDHHFEIHDDIEVLKRMGLAYGLDCGEVPNEHISHIKACLPAALRDYVDQIIEGIIFIFIF